MVKRAILLAKILKIVNRNKRPGASNWYVHTRDFKIRDGSSLSRRSVSGRKISHWLGLSLSVA